MRFRESEYAVPRTALVDVVLAVRNWLEQHRTPLTFPLEIRFIGADDVWREIEAGAETLMKLPEEAF